MPLKKVTELDKSEKLMLLKAVASRDVGKDILDKDTLVAVNYPDMFQGLMVAANNEGTNVICLGKARKAKEMMITDVIVLNNEGEKVLSLKSGESVIK